ncbi:amidohydrolase family protein [Tepidanaerobacter syntrophicus]|uniref:amidohydrolase family protein n=1 Tax=Tepidanaerobacter syntrophicus TaxID=224999 RepID=UPI001BD5C00C|nr:amidohydrolase family protein [Tepidanaerobacter syntrophicus]
MRRIIDFHAHVGDIFHENKNITFKQNVKKGSYPDPFVDLEESGFSRPLIVQDEKQHAILIAAGQYRVWECTLENLTKDLDANKMDHVCLLPVLPNTTFEEYLAASKLEPRIIPFTCADFTLPTFRMCDKLKKDIGMGAKGLKIHPILQNIPLTDPKVLAAVEVFGEAGLPVTTHCGINDYYTSDSPHRSKTNAQYGDVSYVIKLAHKYPDYIIVAAHGGGTVGGEMEILAAETKDLDNVYTDTSFRSAEYMRKAVELFGEDKILFGTDYPFASFKSSITECEKAFADEPEIADKVFYRNSARILHLFE